MFARTLPFAALAALFLAPLAGVDATAETRFEAELRGDLAVPPTPSPGRGTAIFVLDDDGINLSYYIQFSGLLGPELASHVHNAAPGETGQVIFNLGTGSPKEGVWQFVTPAILDELFAGRLYVNIHTSEYTAGEIRGNLMLPLSAEPSTWGRIKAFFQSR